MNTKLKENIDNTSTGEESALSSLINELMNKKFYSVEKLSELTGLSDIAIKRIISGKQHDISLGVFLNIIQGLKYNLIIEKGDIKLNMADYITVEKIETKECPECHQQGMKVATERADILIKKEEEERINFIGKVITSRETEFRSYYSELFLPPSSKQYGEKVFKIKIKLYEAMMVCKECNILFDNHRRKTAKCDPIGYERMLSTADIPK